MKRGCRISWSSGRVHALLLGRVVIETKPADSISSQPQSYRVVASFRQSNDRSKAWSVERAVPSPPAGHAASTSM
ncbi:hypothetical protein XHV734_2624 [Xanthomonas hortorum pv. vitians]|nr:hypothetical protein XHV734_2624 [Xanthomonas hortorum pv. vitians]